MSLSSIFFALPIECIHDHKPPPQTHVTTYADDLGTLRITNPEQIGSVDPHQKRIRQALDMARLPVDSTAETPGIGERVNHTSSFKHLGLVWDSHLSGIHHCIYRRYVRSLLEYPGSVIPFFHETIRKRFGKLHQQALQTVAGTTSTPSAIVLEKFLGIESMEMRHLILLFSVHPISRQQTTSMASYQQEQTAANPENHARVTRQTTSTPEPDRPTS